VDTQRHVKCDCNWVWCGEEFGRYWTLYTMAIVVFLLLGGS
jgi:hypothetical protein